MTTFLHDGRVHERALHDHRIVRSVRTFASLVQKFLEIVERLRSGRHDSIEVLERTALAVRQHDAREAIDLLEGSVASVLKAFGPKHRNLLQVKQTLAGAYHDVGRLEEALRLREEVRALREESIGPTHPDTIQAMSNLAISYAGVGEQITQFLVGLKLSRLEFFAALFVLYTILGCLVESLGMIVITVPLLYPVLLKYGIDSVWFGIILVLFIELGQISPPIGINLFVIQSIWDGKLSDIVWGTIPFHLLMFVLLVMLVFWPEIALWLPHHMSAPP